MSQDHSASDDEFLRNISHQSQTLLVQLEFSVLTMRHIDELLMWLARTFVHRLNMRVAQFWANQQTSTHEVLFEPRASVWQDQSLQGALLTNQYVADLGKRILESSRTTIIEHVSGLFSSYQATLLARHGLHFCAGYALSRSKMLPPPLSYHQIPSRIPTPLALVVLSFFRQVPQEALLLASREIVEQALVLAEKQSLLLLPTTQPFPPPPPAHQPAQSWTLPQLIPRRTQSVEALQAGNPFANAMIISDKKARQLYSAIDGRKSIAELAQQARLDPKELVEALRSLLTHASIQLYGPSSDKAIDTATLLNEFL